MLRNSIRIIVAILTFLYVVLGTLYILSVYPRDYLAPIMRSDPDYEILISIVTFPVYICSFGIRYADSSLLWPVYIIQFVTLVAWLYLADYFVRWIFRLFEKEK